MLALVLAALRARRAQALTLLVLSTLAAAAAAAAPWYVLASTERVATRHMETAPIQERSLETIAEGPIEGGSIAALLAADAELTQRIVGLDGFTTYTQAFIGGQAKSAQPTAQGDTRGTTSPLTLRTGACEHASIEGACATGADEAMLSYRTARWLQVKVGDQITFSSPDLQAPAVLKVVGIYLPENPGDPFWSGNAKLLAVDLPTGAAPEITEPVDDAVLVGPAVLDRLKPKAVRMIVDMVARPALLVDHQPDEVRASLNASTVEAGNNRLTLNTQLHATIDRVERDRQLVSLGVPVGAFQLLVLCWFALYLAVKYTGEERRPDIGLVKLRGATRGRTWALVSGQSALPMLAGAVLGLPVGYLVATAVNGSIREPAVRDRALTLSVGAVALAVLGALLAALLAERRSLGATVAELLRQSPARARAWRDLFDLVLVVVAVAAVWQVKTRAEGDIAGLALLAPGLVALAFALVAARLITYSAGRIVESALRHGRAARALTAIYLARRPGVHRLAALMIVTVALLCTSFLTWSAGREQGRVRAELEVGADRVLSVRAENRLALLHAVRRADPEGRHAMAAVQSLRSGNDRVLLVDSPRLAATATWRPEYGMTAAETAAALHPPAPDAAYVTADTLTLDVTNHYTVVDDQRVVVLDVIMADPKGNRLVARLGPLREGRQRLTASLPACATAPGCRLSSLGIMQSTLEAKIYFPSRPGVEVTVHGISQSGADPTVVARETLTDRTRWRLDVSGTPPNLIVTPAADGLLLRVGPIRQGSTDPGVYPLDSPAPIASIRAKRLLPKIAGDQRVSYGSIALSERVVGTASRLPRLGDQGVLIDLEYADRLGADFGAGESMQVWLSASAPADMTDRLSREGLIVLGEETIDGVADRYGSFGPPLTLQFMLLSAVIGLALAIGSASVVAAVERRPRARELTALRSQGASARLVRRVSVEGYIVLVGVSLLLGLVLAALIRFTIGDVMPYFADGWSAP
ncbi:ABC transporter permease [Dactylosporangium roseum]|uniref:ABC transporter permease n=1 Tax=Dactylosporangium roseum TaxID=47989 RepID=A0ABY5ZCM0_9ACTN|nr:ABC transporter permease [Dactylosporangium roseum]UWZ38084.1 ABC transporter permease [Dactylosporangium roseum]